jgi:ribosomal protein S18 acetylase RimI-like enzyme
MRLPPAQVRDGSAQDLPVLEAMLLEAFYWDPQDLRPNLSEFQKNEEFQKLLAGWGDRAGDVAVVAEVTDLSIGAAWYRFWTPEIHSYGFVDSSIPELAIGVRSEYRSKGVGRVLLSSLISAAESAQVPALSLSVSPANFALVLYESFGFQRVDESGTSLTLLLRLT